MRTILKREDGFAWFRESGIVDTNHTYGEHTGVYIRVKAYLPGRRELTADYLLYDSKAPKKKPPYNRLTTTIRKLGVAHISNYTQHANVSPEEITKICEDLTMVLSGGNKVTLEQIMNKLELPSYELRKFQDSERLELQPA